MVKMEGAGMRPLFVNIEICNIMHFQIATYRNFSCEINTQKKVKRNFPNK